jgi:signal transduction histidine kinase
VWIGILADKDLAITITDNGIGFGHSNGTRRPGNGLGNMHGRIQAIGGRLTILASEGTIIQMKIPL